MSAEKDTGLSLEFLMDRGFFPLNSYSNRYGLRRKISYFKQVELMEYRLKMTFQLDKHLAILNGSTENIMQV